MTIVLVFSSIIFIALLTELVLQLLYRMNYDSPLPYGLRSNSPGRLGYVKLTPNFKGGNKTGILYSTNRYGYRDDEIDAKKKHILFLGDSTTFGININHEDTYPEIFEKLLNQINGSFQSINTASPGQGTFEQLDILRSALAKEELNVRAVVLGFYCNDFSDNYSYVQYKLTEGKGGTFFKAKRFLKEKVGVPRLYLYLKLIHWRLSKRMYKNGHYHGKTGHEIGADLLEEDEIYKNESWYLTVEAIEKISELCTQKDIPFIFIYLPAGEKEIIDNRSPKYKFLLEGFLKSKKIIYVDVLGAYHNYLENIGSDGSLPKDFYSFKGDAKHPGSLACKVIAQELFLTFKENGLLGA